VQHHHLLSLSGATPSLPVPDSAGVAQSLHQENVNE